MPVENGHRTRFFAAGQCFVSIQVTQIQIIAPVALEVPFRSAYKRIFLSRVDARQMTNTRSNWQRVDTPQHQSHMQLLW